MERTIGIIGGGPGGYVAAVRAAQLGATVTLFEEDQLGGTCLNRGCIPTKVLLHTTEYLHNILEQSKNGLIVENAYIDSTKLHKRKEVVVKKLVGGVGALMKANKIKVVQNKATMIAPKQIQSGDETYQFEKIILATGSVPMNIPIPGSDLDKVIDSTQALSLVEPPKSLIIIGGGVIGVEFAQMFAGLGTEVTIVELFPEILGNTDKDIIRVIRPILKRQNINVLTESKLLEIKKENEILSAIIDTKDGNVELSGEYVLMSVGRKPNFEGLNADQFVEFENKVPKVDENFMTSVEGVYAIGDMNKQSMLAHAASAQGIAAVEHAMGHKSHYNPRAIPACIYTSPEIASVGLTEQQAIEQGISYKVSIFPLGANGKSIIENNGVGIVKLISGKKYNEIIGAHIIGPRATDMIAELTLAMNQELTAEEIAATIHPHPTVSEAIQEAAHGLLDGSIHGI